MDRGRKVIYLDMDGVLADFWSNVKKPGVQDPPEMFRRNFFKNMNPMPGAKDAVDRLVELGYDVCIATKPTTKNLYCPTEKYEWVEKHFPRLLRKIFLVCDKTHLNGDFLVDDDVRWCGFNGTFVHFHEKHPLQSWDAVVSYFERMIEVL